MYKQTFNVPLNAYMLYNFICHVNLNAILVYAEYFQCQMNSFTMPTIYNPKSFKGPALLNFFHEGFSCNDTFLTKESFEFFAVTSPFPGLEGGSEKMSFENWFEYIKSDFRRNSQPPKSQLTK